MKEEILNKQSFVSLGNCIYQLNRFNKGIVNEAELENFNRVIYYYNMRLMPLPSGRVGNILALALEMNYYVAASYLINNMDMFDIDIEQISYNKKSKKYRNIKDELVYSVSTMNDYSRLEDDEIRIYIQKNISAYEKLCNIFDIKIDDQKKRSLK